MDRSELAKHLEGIKARTDEAVLVLADWLQQQNHPWGELIVMQSRGVDATKHLEAHPEILGALAGVAHSHFDWERGFLRRAVVGCNADQAAMVAAIETLMAEPIASLIDTVAIGAYRAQFDTWRDWGQSEGEIVDPWSDLEAIANAIPSRITRIGLGGWPAPAAAGYVRMPAFDRVTEAFGKRVTALELTGYGRDNFSVLVLPRCTDLAVRFARGNEDCLAAVFESELPVLERFAIWLGGNSSVVVDDVHSPVGRDEVAKGELRYPATFDADDLEAMDITTAGFETDVDDEQLLILLSAKWPALRHLEIGAPDWSRELLAAIAEAPLVKQASSLTISGGTLMAAEVEQLSREPFAHLDLRITSVIEKAALPKLQETFPGLALRTDGDPEDFLFRYVATVE